MAAIQDRSRARFGGGRRGAGAALGQRRRCLARRIGIGERRDRSAAGEGGARARSEERILLTRDTRLVRRRAMPPHLLVSSQRPETQIHQVLESFGLKPRASGILSRCLICNVATERISREESQEEVPPYVFRTQRRFARCPRCRRIYWRATHVSGMLGRLEEVVGGGRRSAPDRAGGSR